MKKLLTLLLSVGLVISMIPSAAFANTAGGGVN